MSRMGNTPIGGHRAPGTTPPRTPTTAPRTTPTTGARTTPTTGGPPNLANRAPTSKAGAKFHHKAEKALLKGNETKAAKYEAKSIAKDQKHTAKVEAKAQKVIAKMEAKQVKAQVNQLYREQRAPKDAQVKKALGQIVPGVKF
jgi:hypothetical protein